MDSLEHSSRLPSQYVQAKKNDLGGATPSKASLIFLFRSYSSLSLPSRLFRYRYSLLSLAFLLNMIYTLGSRVDIFRNPETADLLSTSYSCTVYATNPS